MHYKKSLLDKVTPKAVLRATTDEARESIVKSCLGKDLIGIWDFPFRIGRESRITISNGQEFISERHKLRDDSKPNNELYLLDRGEKLQISREHFQIEEDANGFMIRDRKSACGTIVNKEEVGGHDKGGNTTLKDGDMIKIGMNNSSYIFEFILLSNIEEKHN